MRNSLPTVRELQRRHDRIDSILDRGAFLLTDHPDTIGLPSFEALDKFKTGLRDALSVTDHIFDLATDPSFDGDGPPQPQPESIDDLVDLATADTMEAWHPVYAIYQLTLAELVQEAIHLRNLQRAHIRAQPTRILCWLLTLASGASRGYMRYREASLCADPGMAPARIMAFGETLLRHGILVIWGFVRGKGSLASALASALGTTAEEIHVYEGSGAWHLLGERVMMPDGLHMTIMGELKDRFVALKRAQMEEEDAVWDEEEWGAKDTWTEINRIVGEEVGCQSWKGYSCVKHPLES